MNSSNFNTIAGGVLLALLVVVSLKNVADIIFAPPVVTGKEIYAASVPAGASVATQKPVPKVPLATLLANASVDKGMRGAKKCIACHTFTKGGPNRIGPNLWNIVGQPLVKNNGFNYSAAFKKRGGNWSWKDLDAFLASPRKALPGTKMSFVGIKKATDRANVLLYLRSLSDAPYALPK